ncbi:capsid protein [Picobirnavirus Equ4]|nr:capsid protein [Picobirnavirus Equ4]
MARRKKPDTLINVPNINNSLVQPDQEGINTSRYMRYAKAIPAGTMSYDSIVGKRRHHTLSIEGELVIAGETESGIMSFRATPTFGVADGSADNILMTLGREIFKKIDSLQSGYTTSYAPVDIIYHLMAVEQMYLYQAYLRKVYTSLDVNLTPFNAYRGPALAAAMGINYADVKQHRLELERYIDDFADQITKYRLPAGFDILNDHISTFCNIFADDANSETCQLYLVNPAAFWFWVDDSETGSQLRRVPFVGRGESNYDYDPKRLYTSPDDALDLEVTLYDVELTFNDLVDYGNKMLESFIYDGSNDEMQSKIMRAFRDQQFYTPSYVTRDMELNFVVDPVFMDAIEHLDLSKIITASEETLDEDEHTAYAYASYAQDSFMNPYTAMYIHPIGRAFQPVEGHVVNSETPDVSIENNYNKTMFMTVSEMGDVIGKNRIKTCRSVIIEAMTIFYVSRYNAGGSSRNPLTYLRHHDWICSQTILPNEEYWRYMPLIFDSTSFTSAPRFKLLSIKGPNKTELLYMGPMENTCVLSDSQLQDMNNAALWSLMVANFGMSNN